MMGVQTTIEKSFKTTKVNLGKGSMQGSQKGGDNIPSQGK
jgi:hypothetical protein